jgi:catechol 2,3-dioxygenase-like lactoylglutathione lyase family enzyme
VSHSTKKVENTIPIPPVTDLAESIRYYTGVLGFDLDWRGDVIGSVSRDRHAIMLSQALSGSSPGWVWIGLVDDSLFENLRSAGVTVHQEPRNQPWAWEMKFQDPDGNTVWLGTEPRSDIPIEGG